jgi:hypothetical protein
MKYLLTVILFILPSWALATGVRVHNPFYDPIVVQYQICNEDEGCQPKQRKLIYGKKESYIRSNRYDCIVFTHINTLEGQYRLKTYSNSPCKIELRGVDHVEGGVTFYVPEQYYNYEMVCQIEVTGPPRSFIIR